MSHDVGAEDTIRFECPSCQKRIRTNQSNIGKKGKCAQCGGVFTVPALPSEKTRKLISQQDSRSASATSGVQNTITSVVNPEGPAPTILSNNSKPDENPQATIGGALVLIGLALLLWGGANWMGANDAEKLYKGTILEGNNDVRTIHSNARNDGLSKMGWGVVLLVAGVVVAGSSKKPIKTQNSETTPMQKEPTQSIPGSVPTADAENFNPKIARGKGKLTPVGYLGIIVGVVIILSAAAALYNIRMSEMESVFYVGIFGAAMAIASYLYARTPGNSE